ncbi:hypothetical protein [uncultured Mycolicibacterium sp.]|uniref:cold-shock protein n=1 Tax=uncultured Mycolicibacterium sp. TaxID=2320817 RepID=UPI00262CCF2D|nr:hypothetical protein [uncultured Mycolicibacterium sp.]
MAVHQAFDIDAVLASLDTIDFGVIRAFDPATGSGLIAPDEGGSDLPVELADFEGRVPAAPAVGNRVSYRIAGTDSAPRAEAVHLL